MKRERIKKYKSKKMSAMILAALLMGTVVQAEPVNNGDTKVHYFSVKSEETGEKSNFDSNGAKGDESMVIGIGSTSNGINSTVVGNNNTLKGGKRDSDGVHRNNSIVVGESIEVEGTHNAVFGTDYMNWDRKLTKVAGEQNTVIGVGNLVGYTAEKDLSDPSNPKWTYTKLYDRGSDANVAVGMTNTVNGGSVVLGTSSEIKDGATLATSVGHANTIQGSEQYGLALGNKLLVEGYGAIAVGTESKATADYATAIGTEAVAEQEDSIAFGDAAEAQSKYSIAFGSFAKAKAGSGVAIGSSSLADREKGSIGYLAGENTSEVWKATRGAVSVGNKEKKYTRQITGVAAGTEDTDAVNVAQLKALNTKMDQGAIHYFSVKSDEKAAGSNFDNDGAKADGSMVIGIGSTSEGINSTVIGKNNKLTGNKEIEDIKSKKVFSLNNSIVAGQNLEVDGYANTVFATESIYDMYQRLTKVAGDHNTVIGAGNLVGYSEEEIYTYTKLDKSISSNKNVVIGTRHTVSGSDNVVLGYLTEFEVGAAGVTAIGSANHIGSETQEGVAIGNNLGINGQSTVAMGFGSGANAKNAIVLGSFSFANAKNAIVLGSDSSADAENSLAIGSESFAIAENGVALGAKSMANREAGMAGYLANGKTAPAWKSTLGALSVGAKFDKVEDTRQITGVAAGTEDTDAVNVAQLKAATEKITGSITDTTLKASDKALSLEGTKLKLSVADTAGNKVTGEVDLKALQGAVDTDTRNTILESDTVKVDATNTNQDGSINYKLNVKTDGKVEKNNKGVINGGTVYKETRIEKDGNYIKAGNTAGENLIALDKQVGVNSTNITKLENNIYNMGTRVGELDNRMNKVGAGAAALAALHPLDFDPDDKWDIAAGIGNYKNATAAAVGFFYRPNERTMLNLGWTMGDNRNMVNGGFSIKLGSGANISTSKTAMVREIRTLRDVVSQQNEQIERQNRKIEKQEREMKEVLEILAEMRKDKK